MAAALFGTLTGGRSARRRGPGSGSALGSVPASRVAPGPRGSLLLGSLPAYKRDPVRFFVDLQAAYGDVVRFRLGPYPAHLVTHPDGIRHVIQVNDRNYCRGRFYEKFKLFFGTGLLTTDGDEWRSHRQVVQPAFLRTVIGASTRHVSAATEATLWRWELHALQAEPIRLLPETAALTLASLSKTLFGLDVSDASAAVGRAVDFGASAMFNQGTFEEMLPPWVPTRRNRAIARQRRVLHEMARPDPCRPRPGRSGGGPRPAARSGDRRADPRALARQHRARRAAHRVPRRPGDDGAGPCLDAAVGRDPPARTGRVGGRSGPGRRQRPGHQRPHPGPALHPYGHRGVDAPAPAIWLYTRDAVGADEVLGYRVPAGSSVLVSPYVTHRLPDLWPAPETFDPQRFDPRRRERRPRFAYFPFGGGPRQCIGMHLALHELTVMLALISARFRLEFLGADPVVGRPVVSLRPVREMQARLVSRDRVRRVLGDGAGG